jgi:hypothetical protein
LQDGFLGEGSPDDNGKNTVESWENISVSYQVGVLMDDVAEENKVLALGVYFLTEQPFLENFYCKQKNTKRAKIWKATFPTLPTSK